jgi:hypothetical protein
MFSLSNRKFKNKKIISDQIKALILKTKVLKPTKKKVFSRFFLQSYSLDKKNALILRLLQLRTINSVFLNLDNKFELKTSFYQLVKLSQSLNAGLKSENSLDILPFFFQESFLVSSFVEQRKKKNFLHLIKKPFSFFTNVKKRKRFKTVRRIFNKKVLKKLRRLKLKPLKKNRISKKSLVSGKVKQLSFLRNNKVLFRFKGKLKQPLFFSEPLDSRRKLSLKKKEKAVIFSSLKNKESFSEKAEKLKRKFVSLRKKKDNENISLKDEKIKQQSVFANSMQQKSKFSNKEKVSTSGASKLSVNKRKFSKKDEKK